MRAIISTDAKMDDIEAKMLDSYGECVACSLKSSWLRAACCLCQGFCCLAQPAAVGCSETAYRVLELLAA